MLNAGLIDVNKRQRCNVIIITLFANKRRRELKIPRPDSCLMLDYVRVINFLIIIIITKKKKKKKKKKGNKELWWSGIRHYFRLDYKDKYDTLEIH